MVVSGRWGEVAPNTDVNNNMLLNASPHNVLPEGSCRFVVDIGGRMWSVLVFAGED
jgi:hypothetical protein